MGTRGPKPGFKRAQQLLVASTALAAVSAAAVPADTQAAQEPAPAAQVVHKDPLQRSRDIKTMEPDELKAYAKQIGVRQRDIEELSIDRLRQNCMLTVASLIAAYTN